jgi:exosortase/archaeosortase family protein
LPAILVAIFGFSVMFPVLITRFFEESYSQSVLAPLLALMNAINYPMQQNGQIVSFTRVGGENISANIAIECAGPTTMAIFIVLYVLMMLDSAQSPRRAAFLFFLGVAGTWLQSLIRLVILMVTGWNFGNSAMWTAHYWTVYLLFPLWYLAFAWIYFRLFKKSPAGGEKAGLKLIDAAQK